MSVSRLDANIKIKTHKMRIYKTWLGYYKTRARVRDILDGRGAYTACERTVDAAPEEVAVVIAVDGRPPAEVVVETPTVFVFPHHPKVIHLIQVNTKAQATFLLNRRHSAGMIEHNAHIEKTTEKCRGYSTITGLIVAKFELYRRALREAWKPRVYNLPIPKLVRFSKSPVDGIFQAEIYIHLTEHWECVSISHQSVEVGGPVAGAWTP